MFPERNTDVPFVPARGTPSPPRKSQIFSSRQKDKMFQLAINNSCWGGFKKITELLNSYVAVHHADIIWRKKEQNSKNFHVMMFIQTETKPLRWRRMGRHVTRSSYSHDTPAALTRLVASPECAFRRFPPDTGVQLGDSPETTTTRPRLGSVHAWRCPFAASCLAQPLPALAMRAGAGAEPGLHCGVSKEGEKPPICELAVRRLRVPWDGWFTCSRPVFVPADARMSADLTWAAEARKQRRLVCGSLGNTWLVLPSAG